MKSTTIQERFAAAKRAGAAEGSMLLAMVRGGSVPTQLQARQIARDIVSAPLEAVRVVSPQAMLARRESAASESAAPTVYSVGVDVALYVPCSTIAEVCGLGSVALHTTYRPSRWVRETHWIEREGVVLYRTAFVHELVGELAIAGQPRAAGLLMQWLTIANDCAAGSGETGDHRIRGAQKNAAPARTQDEAAKPWYSKGQYA